MLTATLAENTFQALEKAVAKAKLAQAIEIRFDYLNDFCLQKTKALLKKITKPVIFTFRDPPNFEVILALAKLGPNFLDLDHQTSLEIQKQVAKYTKIIGSYHNFGSTPDLDLIDLSSPYFTFKKLAVKVTSSIELLRVLFYMKKHPNTVAIAMGEIGKPSRILAKIFKAPFTYACIDKPLKDTGQLSLSELIHIYRYPQIHSQTKIYALIGDPICYSQGHIWHNARFSHDAIYVKCLVRKNEVHRFLNLAKTLPIEGISITMPLKNIAPMPINTLYRKQNRYFWDNTDGQALVEALLERTSLRNKRVLILGGGGTAIASAIVLKNHEAQVQIHTRSPEKIAHLGFELVDQVQGYDILVHATPVGMNPNTNESMLKKEQILSQKIVVDFVSNPGRTQLLKWAKERGCPCIDGKELFERQAKLQQSLWKNYALSQEKFVQRR